MSFHARSAEGPPTFWHPGNVEAPNCPPWLTTELALFSSPSARSLRI